MKYLLERFKEEVVKMKGFLVELQTHLASNLSVDKTLSFCTMK